MRTFDYVWVEIGPSLLATFVLLCPNGEKNKIVNLCVFYRYNQNCQLRFSHNYMVL